MARLPNRIICDYEKNKVFCAIVGKLMSLPRLENECVPGFDFRRSFGMPDDTLTRDHLIKLPLRAMRVKGIGSHARRYSADLNIKWVPLFQVRRKRFASQFF